MQESTKRIRELEEKVIGLEAVVRHEKVSRRQELKVRDREIRNLSRALFKRCEEVRTLKMMLNQAWKGFRERMEKAGLDVNGEPTWSLATKVPTISASNGHLWKTDPKKIAVP